MMLDSPPPYDTQETSTPFRYVLCTFRCGGRMLHMCVASFGGADGRFGKQSRILHAKCETLRGGNHEQDNGYLFRERNVKMSTSRTILMRRTQLLFLVALGMLLLFVCPAASQLDDPAGKPASVPAPAASAAGSMEVKYEAGKLSVKADKADLGSLLKTISGLAGIGIETAEGVTGSVSLSFLELPLEEGINRILEAAAARSFAATFRKVAAGTDGAYRMEKVIVAKKTSNAPDEAELPPDLDTTRPAGMFIDEKRLRYLGKGRVSQPVIHLGEGERLSMVLHQKKNYDSVLIWKDKKYYFRILDKLGNLIFEKEVPDGVRPSLVGNTEMFVEPRLLRYISEGIPILGGLTFYNFKGEKQADVTPEETGEITIRATTPEGLVIVNATGGLDIYNMAGGKLSHLASRPDRSELSPDNKYIYIWESDLSDHTRGAYLFDLNGHLVSKLWGKREEGVEILAVSSDSSFFMYQKTDLNTKQRMTHLVDLRTLDTVGIYPIRERSIAISDGARYIAAFGTGYPRENGTYIFPRYFRFYDGNGVLLCEFGLGEDQHGPTPAQISFVTKTRAKAVFGDDVYYFESIAEGG